MQPTLLTLAHRDRVTDYLRRFPPLISELTFTNLFVWRQGRPIWFLECADHLVFLTKPPAADGGWCGFGPPVGPGLSAAALRAALPDVREFIRLPEDTARALEREGLRVAAEEDQADYVYRRADLAELPGEKYHKKRNLIRQCLAAHECRYENITATTIPACLALVAQWCRSRQCERDPSLCHEYQAIQELFAHYEALNLIGGAIRVNGAIQALAVGEALSPDTAVCHFEKALPETHGLSQLINHWFAAFALQDFAFVNREQDLGLPGLRQAKESYHPHHRVWKYRARWPAGMQQCNMMNAE